MSLTIQQLSSTFRYIILIPTIVILGTGCSVRQLAVNQVGNALSQTGTSFTSDDDPEFVAQALPFGLKLMESVLAETPNHQDLLLATAKGYTQYSYAFVYLEATKVRETDYFRARQLELRSKKLFLRARNYALQGLEVRFPGFRESLRADPKSAVQSINLEDVALLYWTAASWAAAITADKTDAYLMADLPKVDALVDRIVELDERLCKRSHS
jgi:hypothetical protein